MLEIVTIIYRSVAVYFFIVLTIRLFGKKELSQLSIIDLVFILLISNSVQNAMVGNNSSLVGGLTAAASLFVVNAVLKNVLYRSKTLSRFLQGSPVILIYHGKVFERHLNEAKISRDELSEAVREHGVKNINDVDLAVLEVDGNISILSNNFHRKTTKRRKAHKIVSRSG